MLFTILCKARETSMPRERIMRRLEYHFPETVHILGEYWPVSGGDPAVIMIVEADTVQQVMGPVYDWSDVFDIQVFPTVTGEEGMKLAKEHFTKVGLEHALTHKLETAVR